MTAFTPSSTLFIGITATCAKAIVPLPEAIPVIRSVKREISVYIDFHNHLLSSVLVEQYNCAGGDRDRVTSEYTQNFILELINYLKSACNVNVRQRLKIPVAVVFGKIDAVQRHLGSAMVLQSSGHAAQGSFIENESQQIHSEISGWMENCGDNLNRLFDANIEKWCYFGVSSFGSLPTSRTKIQRPMPLRVLDPLIWDLSLEGIVKTI